MDDIRDVFFINFYKELKKNKKLILLSVDQGAMMLKKIQKDFPSNFINIGISEQNAVNFAAGLAKEGYTPYIYLISAFVLRCIEQIKINLCSMNFKVGIIGSGPGFSYASDGPTHYFHEDYGLLKNYPNLNFFCTSDPNSSRFAFEKSYQSKNSSFIRLEKGAYPNFSKYSKSSLLHVFKGKKILIVTNGYLSNICFEIINDLKAVSDFGLLDIRQFIPLNFNHLKKIFKFYNKIIFIDESSFISSINKELLFFCLSDSLLKSKKYFTINTSFRFWKIAGDRNYLLSKNNLDKKSLKEELLRIKNL